MQRNFLLIVVFVTFFYVTAYADDNSLKDPLDAKTIFQVEDNSHTALPVHVQDALKANNFAAYSECDLVGSLVDIGSINNEKYYAVAGRQGRCGGSGSAPVWIVREKNNGADVILADGGYHIEVLESDHSGLKDLRISGGNAGSAFVDYWQYNGQVYVQKISKYFDGSCKKVKEDPDNPFDCTSD